MNHEYSCRKELLSKKDVEFAYVFFTNGEYFQIRKNEIIEIAFNLYDRLIFAERNFSPVAESGFIKLRIQAGKAKGESRYLCHESEYVKNRKDYIENRLATDGAISHVYLFNENNWHHTIYGDIKANIEGEYIFLRFIPNKLYGSSAGDCHTVRIMPIKKDSIFKIHLDFENCESFDIYQNEIIDMELVFDSVLEWNADAYSRVITGGYIRLRLDKYFSNRNVHHFKSWENPYARITLKDLEKRLCGKGKDDIDICHLYITFNEPGYGIHYEEQISVNEINDYNDIDDEGYEPPFISGYAEKQSDGSILIVFGQEK